MGSGLTIKPLQLPTSALARFAPTPAPTITILSVLIPDSQTSKPVSPEGSIWHSSLGTYFRSIGPFPPVRLRRPGWWTPSPRVLSSGPPTPVSDILALVAPSKIFATSLLGTCQTGFHFSGSLDFVRPKAPIRDGVPRTTGNVPNRSTRNSYRNTGLFFQSVASGI